MAGLFGIADSFGNQVKKLFNPSKVRIDNFIFTLHHQWTFVIVIVGLIFATGNNYLNKDAMICNGGNSYVNAFCFLHGSAHVAKSLQEEITSATACVSEDDDDTGENRTTTYYIWLPFILAIIAIMIKMPWILWKNILERGLMKKLNADMDQDGSKTAERFLKVVLRGRRYSVPALVYNFGFAFCEMLNLAVVLISQSILDSLLNSEFASYGLNVQNYRSFVNDEALRKLPEAVGPRNPMCQLFPTEVSCSVRTGGITGNANRENILCLLPNNIFYQYYFLILWWWWVVLIFITCLGLVYRLVQITVPAFGRLRLSARFDMMGVPHKHRHQIQAMSLKPWETFLLLRLVRTLKGSQVIKLLEAIEDNKTIRDNSEETMDLVVQMPNKD